MEASRSRGKFSMGRVGRASGRVTGSRTGDVIVTVMTDPGALMMRQALASSHSFLLQPWGTYCGLQMW